MEEFDFASSLDSSFEKLKINFQRGEKLKGKIVSIDKNSVFVDIGSMSEGIINRDEFKEKDEFNLVVGDEIEAYYIAHNSDGILLTVKMSGDVVDSYIEAAYASQIPVEGKVLKERKGGYSVKVGNTEAFCPYSQMSLRRDDTLSFTGNTYNFLIQEFKGNNCVVSRRDLLEEELIKEKEELKTTLSTGDIVTGIVKKIFDYGAFVNIGAIDGFIPVSEVSWSRKQKIRDVISEGENIKCVVKDIDWDNEKISLSYKSAGMSWGEISGKYYLGSVHKATSVRFERYGAFLELEEGIEGLLHISKIAGNKRVNNVEDELTLGETIEVCIDDLDDEKCQISLAIPSGDVTPEKIIAKAAEKEELKEAKAKSASFGGLDDMFGDLKL